MVKKNIDNGFFFVLATSVFFGVLVIPIDFLISLKSGSIGFVPAVLLAFRSPLLIMLIVIVFNAGLLIVFRLLLRVRSEILTNPLKKAITIGSGTFVILFFVIFNRFYNKLEALVAAEAIGGTIAVLVTWVFYLLMRSGSKFQRLTAVSPKVPVIGTILIVVLFGISFVGGEGTQSIKRRDYESGKSDRPNILLIVLDTVRADRLSLYGHNKKTTPFLEKMAAEATVFNNAYAASPWTLPSHASLFTGLYPSRHNAHAEHMWLDNSYRTLAEMLHDNGYQTVCFSNNGYVTPYHNLTKGFERIWYKGGWADAMKMLKTSLGGSVVSSFKWLWDRFQTHVLAKIIKNPASIWDSPTAGLTNKAVSKWFDQSRLEKRPFFIFINYMDAHFPYNPDDETARLFLNEDELKLSYNKNLRFPPIEYYLDLSKSGFTQTDIRIISTLYDACIRYLDGQLAILFKKLIDLGIYEETLIIITSDHGEYLGTRNRLAHGLGLHDEVLHVPLIIRYPALFKPGIQYDPAVTHIDITATILAAANIKEQPIGPKETQLLFNLQEDNRPYVFAEFRFPLHALITTSLLEDNSHLFVEQKTIHSQKHQLIWKSRGEPEFYNVVEDPLQVNNLYAIDNEIAEKMSQQLASWSKSLDNIPQATSEVRGTSEKDNLELLERLRGIGYIK